MTEQQQDLLAKEFQFYLDNQDELVTQYDGRIIVIKDGQILGDYNSDAAAIAATIKTHQLGTFLVQRASAGQEAYTQTFHWPRSPLGGKKLTGGADCGNGVQA